jgi:hypothetical protein
LPVVLAAAAFFVTALAALVAVFMLMLGLGGGVLFLGVINVAVFVTCRGYDGK